MLICEALETPLTEISAFEKVVQQRVRRIGNNDTIGFCDALKSGCKIGCFAYHGAFLRCAIADDIADDDRSGRYADPRRQRGEGVESGE